MKAAQLEDPFPVRPVRLAPLRFVFVAALVSLVAGCASSYNVKVDSLARPGKENVVSYEIHNANPLVADDSLRYKEAVGYVKTALSGKGLYEAPEKTKPDLVVDVDYGIGPPQIRTETMSEPVYVEVPGATRTETVQVGTDAKGNPIYTTVLIQEPSTQRFAGFREYQITITVYEKYLRLTARESEPESEGRPPTEVWSVDVTSEGESRDVRKHLPVLVAASIEYIGQDTHGQKTIKLKDNNADIAFVKKGM
jgi:hypothetical protein